MAKEVKKRLQVCQHVYGYNVLLLLLIHEAGMTSPIILLQRNFNHE